MHSKLTDKISLTSNNSFLSLIMKVFLVSLCIGVIIGIVYYSTH
jgi:hypothetical protein